LFDKFGQLRSVDDIFGRSPRDGLVKS